MVETAEVDVGKEIKNTTVASRSVDGGEVDVVEKGIQDLVKGAIPDAGTDVVVRFNKDGLDAVALKRLEHAL